MRVALLFSGGKDSTYASWIIQHQAWDLAVLLTLKPRSNDSMMFHYPNVRWTRLQAESLVIKHEIFTVEDNDELQGLTNALSRAKAKYGIEGVVTGALASDYQKTRIDRSCDDLQLKSYGPVWHKSPVNLLKDLHQNGFNIIMTRTAANGLDKSWLGHMLTKGDWDKLESLSIRYGFNITGEGGEYETFVVDAPHFTKSIEIRKAHVETEGEATMFLIDDALLHEKR